MTNLFLACDGYFNVAVVEKNFIKDGSGPDLLIDEQLVKTLDASNVTKQIFLLNLNQICDAGFELATPFWELDSNPDNGASLGIDLNEKWSLYNGHTLFIHQNQEATASAELIYQDPVVGELLPVDPNAIYQLTGSFGMHRCEAVFIVEYYDKHQKIIQRYEKKLPEGKIAGVYIEDYLTVSERIQTPNKAAFAKIIIRKLPSNIPANDSFLFFTQPFFALTSSNLTTLLNWEKCLISVEDWRQLRTFKHTDLVRIDFQLPESAYDGANHSIELIDRISGTPLAGSPKNFCYETDVTGKLERLVGTQAIGWISKPESRVELHIDGHVLQSVSAKAAGENGGFYFQIPLPNALLDGRPHRLEAKIPPSGQSIGELAEITPCVLTTWDALQKFAGKPLPAKLSPAAAYRYDSMRATLLALSEAEKQGRKHEQKMLLERVSILGNLHEKLVAGFDKSQKFEPLVFPQISNPDVSIIVPVHNKFAVTYHCLVALLFAYNRTSFEVILVDDGSSDETVDIQELVTGIVYLRNEISEGFIRSCNRGAHSAQGRYVVMLNNDTEITVRWLDELIFAFEQFDQVGLAGSKLLYPNGKLQEAGGIVWSNGNPWNYGRGGNPNEPRFNYTRQADYLSGASVMIPKPLWDKIGGFSEEYCPAYFEDTDLAFKVRAAGYKTLYVPLSVVYHFEGMSSGTSVTEGTKRFQEINRPKFKQKWIQACRFNGEEGKDIDLNKDRGINYRALVIDYQTPRIDIDAGSYAAIQEIRLLQSLGFKVTFVPENFTYMGQYTEFLQRIGVESVYAPFEYNMQDFLEHRGHEFDVVYITRYYVAKKHIDLIRHYAPKAKILFCNADLHFLRELREGIQRNDPALIDHARATRDEELNIMLKADVTLSYNEIEHAVVLSHNLGNTKVVKCPWVVEVKKHVPGFAERTDIAFLGGFGHPPNKSAMQFFVIHVMPLLRQPLPGVKFRICGSNIPEEIEKLAGDDVIIEGYVEDISSVYDQCRVFIAPLLTGAGIKGKVIEALAHGTPSVLSPIAAEGTLLRSGLEVLIAETAQEWAEAINKLYTDETLWSQTSKAARDFAKQRYSFENGRKLMLKALETADMFASTENHALVVKHARPSAN